MTKGLFTFKAIRSLLPSKERTPIYYDITAKLTPNLRSHYSKSRYYFLWSVIADRLIRAGSTSLLDLGCGAGQFACLMHDKGINNYIGVDFSPYRVQLAKKACPKYTFVQADIFTANLFDACNYDTVIVLEFLEHIEKDLDVLACIRQGAQVYATVPDFPSPGHVRHFKSVSQVQSRYKNFFDSMRVDTFIADTGSKTYYLIDGIKV